MAYALAVHGGAGLIRADSLSPAREAACREALVRALAAGEAVLRRGGAALDAVTAAVVVLEDDPVFNAGRGAVLCADGSVELDAAVMDGRTRAAGAVAAAKTPRNPVMLARAVMERTPHVLVVGAGADVLAAELGLSLAARAWFVTPEREAQLAAATGVTLDHDAKADVYGTVGAVAADRDGHVAAATSTGGMTGQRPGRVGDTPVIGAGTWAWDRTCAVSGTGHGEPFVRLGVGQRISALCELAGLDLAAAAERVIREELPGLEGRGGVIAVDGQGNVAMPFNTAGMFRGSVREGEAPVVAIW
ncbi:MAG: isoaspartyl peptidase/L-asparaginase [Myxococcota bacterium]